jgi:hypothetical protein
MINKYFWGLKLWIFGSYTAYHKCALNGPDRYVLYMLEMFTSQGKGILVINILCSYVYDMWMISIVYCTVDLVSDPGVG